MMKIKYAALLFSIGVILFTACQKTPEQNAVVNRAEKLDESVIAKQNDKGVVRKTDLPENWKAEAERGENGMVKLKAALKTKDISLTNTQVIEVAPTNFNEKYLQELVTHFSAKEELYVPKVKTETELEEEYRFIQQRVENKEGYYGNPYNIDGAKNYLKEVEASIEDAPETLKDEKLTDITFDEKNSFQADVGKDREAVISASNYNKKDEIYSSFTYLKGVTEYEEIFEIQDDTKDFFIVTEGQSSFANTTMKEMLSQFRSALDQNTLDAESGLKEAEQLLKELGVTNMVPVSEKRIEVRESV